MKTLFTIPGAICLFVACFSCRKQPVPPAAADRFKVTVTNGYGSGYHQPGDTVHIFSLALASNQVFAGWSGHNPALLRAPDEWHTWFIMPGENVDLTGTTAPAATFVLQFEQCQGKDRVKPVYYYFPARPKGIVYLLHGTSGSAQALVAGFEWQQMIKDLVHDHFAVLITEAEEATAGKDLNGDGSIRWNTLPWDTLTNADYANIRIITHTFYQRGLLPAGLPKYAVGMSNGGNFATALSTICRFDAGVSYCAPSGGQIAQMTGTPLQFCMARFDQNPNVGPAGNAAALANAQTLASRGISSGYLVQERSPLYPERFARSGQLSLEASAAVFNELKQKGYLDPAYYFMDQPDELRSAYQANPAAFPQLNGLDIDQRMFVFQQLSLAVADHHMYSDYNKATLKFLNTFIK
ncbi:hypothetical protein [Niabella drilacis]|uniref:Uncharacterized protein n=1 Tax=Niabella drilacis (strain DSM 25811 / CCM 8410 / CCUG 62505 / LMG 26954 / E90) TaxID=1285928 RepID=A0A1G7ADC8_NIADE|nr:hypothetical protein [Niabella drilacis]SDE12770.1 hypothetical protein SAMN04487894_12252 [Niabella drilacis]